MATSVKSFFQTAITAFGGGSGSSRVATITGITNITSIVLLELARFQYDNDLFGVSVSHGLLLMAVKH